MRKNIGYLYLYSFFDHFIVAYVIERLFALNWGLSVQTIVLLGILYAALTFALEVPSGILADRFGRKALLCIGAFFCTFEFAALIFSGEIGWFIVSTFGAAIGNACISGTKNALLYDTLTVLNRQSEFEAILGRMKAIGLAAALLAGLAGGALSEVFEFRLHYLLSAACMVLAFLVTLLLKEPRRTGSSGVQTAHAREIVKSALQFFRSHISVLFMALGASIIAIAVEYADEFWQVYLHDVGFPLKFFGFASAAFSLISIPGALAAPALLRRLSHKQAAVLASILTCLFILFAALVRTGFGMIGILLALFLLALMEPVRDGYIHHRADPNGRATIESALSMASRGISIVLGLIFGYLSSHVSIFVGYGCLGIAVLAAAPCFLSMEAK